MLEPSAVETVRTAVETHPNVWLAVGVAVGPVATAALIGWVAIRFALPAVREELAASRLHMSEALAKRGVEAADDIKASRELARVQHEALVDKIEGKIDRVDERARISETLLRSIAAKVGVVTQQIAPGDLEAVGALENDAQALARGVRQGRLEQQHAHAVGGPAADPAAQLVQLRQAERVGAGHEQRVGARDVEAALDDGRRAEHVVLALHEVEHRLLQRDLAHLPVRHTEPRGGEQLGEPRGPLVDRHASIRVRQHPFPIQFPATIATRTPIQLTLHPIWPSRKQIT